MNYMQRSLRRAAMARAARAPQPMTRGPRRAPMYRGGFRGADLGGIEGVTIYVLVPMGLAVVAGLWMAFH